MVGSSGSGSRLSDMKLTVNTSAAVGEIKDPRELPLEQRLEQAKEHEAKLKHIMETVPIKIRHMQGSSAGAGSGEFHIYRNARNQEQKRLRDMEARWKEEQHNLLQKRKYEDAQQAIDARTAKNRAKRQKRKGKHQVTREATTPAAGEAHTEPSASVAQDADLD